MKKAFFVIITLVLVISCTSMPQRLSSIPPEVEYEELGQATCKKCSFLLFGVIPIMFRSMPWRAYQCAVKSKGGDDLINPIIYESWYWAYIMNIYCTTVSGTVIKKK